MSIIRRVVIGATAEPDERRYARPEQLVCPVCREPARAQQPAYWRVADGQVPAWSHHNGEPLCPVLTDDGLRPAHPTDIRTHIRTARATTERLSTPEPKDTPMARHWHLDPRDDRTLPDTVVANIPRTPTRGEPLTWADARALLLDTAHAVGARPLAVQHLESYSDRPLSTTRTTIATLRLDNDRALTVTTTSYLARRNSSWHIDIDGTRVTAHDRPTAPPAAEVAVIVRDALAQTRRDAATLRPVPDTAARRGLERS